MKLNRISLLLVAATTFFITLFWIKGLINLDPDFGWHLRMGQVIQESGIPKTDPFSYTMPSYPFVDHEWLFNLVLSKLYPEIGMIGLAFIFALIALSAVLVQVKFPLNKYLFIPFLLILTSLMVYTGIRPQVISWLFFSFTIAILLNPKIQKLKFFLPIIILFWTNLHGSFGMGLFVLLVVFTTDMIQKKKLIYSNIGIFLLSVAVTFINPYGGRIWWEVWMQLTDSSLRWSIVEWMPALVNLNFAWWLYATFSLLLVFRYKKGFSLSELSLYFLLLLAGLSSTRHFPFWLILSLPITVKAFELLSIEAGSIKYATKRLNKAYFILVVLIIIVLIFQSIIGLATISLLNEDSQYPKKAVNYLKMNNSPGNIFALYEWGGYLIWKYPEKKVFIDGRMPSWRRDQAPPDESKYAFEEYNDLMKDRIYADKIINKYYIDTFLLQSQKSENTNIITKKVRGFWNKLTNNTKNSKDLEEQLQELGFIEKYKDETAVVYRKKEN